MAEAPSQSHLISDRRDALRVVQKMSPYGAFLPKQAVWAPWRASAPPTPVLSPRISCSRVGHRCRRPAAQSGGFQNFSDITDDIRALAPDLIANAGVEALPPTRSQEQRWTRPIRVHLADWVQEEGRRSSKGSYKPDSQPGSAPTPRSYASSSTACSKTMPSSGRK